MNGVWTTILFTIISFLPVLLLGYYIYKKDSVKEPKTLLTKLVLCGLIASLLVIILDIVLTIVYPNLHVSNYSTDFSPYLLFILIFLEVGLLEESMKWFMIRIVGYDNPEFDQIYDIIVYCVFIAIGFAFFENLFYVLQGGLQAAVLRGLLAVPAHAVYGVFMGYFLGKAKLSKNKSSLIKYIFLSIFVPAVMHTIYDYILMFNSSYSFYILIGYMLILYVTAYKIDEKLKKKKKPFRKKEL